ncbi:phosphotransferase family protein [Actinoplanes sp. CA-030573]|uniref:phosphotransferase family protein n=1 Tax=Actinoplanes sp. CA-030573 TaxID=3239898 RepID=UPI003D93391F
MLPDGSPASLAEAIGVVAPSLAGLPVEMRPPTGDDDPMWASSTAIVGGAYVAKFAWSPPAARRLAHEIAVLTALAGDRCIPSLVAAAPDPALLITRRVAGESLYAAAPPGTAGRQLASFLAALHHPGTRARVEAVTGPLPEAADGSQHPVPTRVLRSRLDGVSALCDWIDETLAPPRPPVLVHADLHGDNQVWSGGRLRLVVDFETVALAEPEYELRALPGTAVFAEVVRHYESLTGRRVDLARVRAWHIRTALHDALWRGEPANGRPDLRLS